MARKTQPDSGGSTATAERKTRTRKSPKEKAESLVVIACNAIDALGYMAEKLNEAQREGVLAEFTVKLKELDEAFAENEEEAEEPEPFSLPD